MTKWSDKRIPSAAAVFLLFVSLAATLGTISRHSLTFDAIKYAPAGYDYLRTGEIRLDPENPPVGKALLAAPLFFLNVDAPNPRNGSDIRGFQTGWDFYHKNRIPAPKLAFYSRLASAAASLLLGGVFFLWARKRFGAPAAAIGLTFFIAGPMFRALSALATTDMILAALFLSAVYCLERFAEGSERKWLLAAGAAAAAGFLTKFSGLLFYPLAAVFLFWKKPKREALTGLLWLGAILAALTLVVYRSQLPALLEGLYYQNRVLAGGPPMAFFLGELGNTGWPHYYLVSLFLKTPYPFILAVVLGGWAWYQSKDRYGLAAAAAPFLLFLLLASRNKFYATRYLFPTYSFLALIIAAGWFRGGKRVRTLIAALALWQVSAALWAYPHYLSYMNRPWRKEAHRYLSNSDFDWGQNLPALADAWNAQGRPAMHLCYFGTSDPKAWGVTAQELATVPGITSSNTVLPYSPEREFLAVSAGCRQFMQVGYEDGRTVRAWEWLEAEKPVAVVANSIYIYDIKKNIAAHGRIGQLHAGQKRFPQAFRQANRILEIDPANKKGREFLKFLQEKTDSP